MVMVTEMINGQKFIIVHEGGIPVDRIAYGDAEAAAIKHLESRFPANQGNFSKTAIRSCLEALSQGKDLARLSF